MAANQVELKIFVHQTEIINDPFISKAIRITARAIVEDAAKVGEGEKVLLWFDIPGVQLVQEMELACLARGAEVRFFMRKYESDAEAIAHLNKEEIREMFDAEEELINWADNVLIVRNPDNPLAFENVPVEKAEVYQNRYSQVHQRRISGEVKWTLFYWPTQFEAEKEGMPYREYFKVYMEACDQPWVEIYKAQEVLKEMLDNGKELVLIANEDDPNPKKRTRVKMSIAGMTFANSTIDANYPGSEVFSAPKLDSVEGQIFAEGEYMYDGYLMENIYLKIEHGMIVEAYAEKGNDYLQAILDRNNGEEGFGSRFFGEVALGTNPGLTRRFFNALLNEKVGGSFHMAIGHCYDFTEYMGIPVVADNGNTDEHTSVHWDLTILMHRRPDGKGGGKVLLDGEVIQEDGFFLDSRLVILNRE